MGLVHADSGRHVYPGHVNNVAYVRHAETARINWARNFAVYLDPSHKQEWTGLMGSTGLGWILRSIKVDYKFVGLLPRPVSFSTKKKAGGMGDTNVLFSDRSQ